MFRLLFARRADWAAFTVACVLSLTLMSLGRGPQARAVWFVQHTLLAPVNAVVGWLDAGVGVYWENQKLKKRLAQMQMEADAMRAERVENARLRGLLHLSQENPSDLASARVVARSLDRLGGSLTIDKGEKDGILPNRAVLTPDGLVGRVDRSTSHEARVLTLLHRDCSVAVRVGRSRVVSSNPRSSSGRRVRRSRRRSVFTFNPSRCATGFSVARRSFIIQRQNCFRLPR